LVGEHEPEIDDREQYQKKGRADERHLERYRTRLLARKTPKYSHWEHATALIGRLSSISALPNMVVASGKARRLAAA
jgi:hypothetical protein